MLFVINLHWLKDGESNWIYVKFAICICSWSWVAMCMASTSALSGAFGKLPRGTRTRLGIFLIRYVDVICYLSMCLCFRCSIPWPVSWYLTIMTHDFAICFGTMVVKHVLAWAPESIQLTFGQLSVFLHSDPWNRFSMYSLCGLVPVDISYHGTVSCLVLLPFHCLDCFPCRASFPLLGLFSRFLLLLSFFCFLYAPALIFCCVALRHTLPSIHNFYVSGWIWCLTLAVGLMVGYCQQLFFLPGLPRTL